MESSNPLTLFPTKHDIIRHNFIGFKKSQSLATLNKSTLVSEDDNWISPERADPSFGISGASTLDKFARNYRRVASSGLFTKMDKKLTPLSHIDPTPSHNKNYILIEESRLQNLLEFDAVLQRERNVLQQQCATVFLDRHMPAWIPLPATRHAVHHLCEQEMSRARFELTRLNSAWHEHKVKNHYESGAYPIYMKKSFVDIAPPAQRALKLRLVKQARRDFYQRLERDSMIYEDGLSYYSNMYHDALLRQKDYERYYILANRYGPFNEQEYNQDARPGKRYYTKVVKGALKLQLLWDRYYAIAKLRRYRACRLIQKYWRRFIVYRKLHPIIRLRLKLGKRTYYMFCMSQWKRYVYICKLIKEAITFYRSNYVAMCFVSWKKWFTDKKAIQKQKLRTMMIRAQNSGTYNTFHRWKKFIVQKRDLKRKLKRYFGFPFFDMWLDHVKWCKHVKKLNAAACRAQAMIRVFIAKKERVKVTKAYMTVQHFMKLVAAVRKVRNRKNTSYEQEFELWLPGELKRRQQKLNEEERQRLQRKHMFIAETERKEVYRLQEYLSTKDGNHLLQEVYREYQHNHKSTHKYLLGLDSSKLLRLSGAEKKKKIYDFISYQIKKELVSMVRVLEGHQYDMKSPPMYTCYHYQCGATFTTEFQYHHHIEMLQNVNNKLDTVTSHPREGIHCHSLVSHFHLLLKHFKGQEILRQHYINQYGVNNNLLNLLDCYLSIQEWKKHSVYKNSYYLTMFTIYDVYLHEQGVRKLLLDPQSPHYRALLDLAALLDRCKYMDITSFKGYYHNRKPLASGVMKGLLGWQGSEYSSFTTEFIMPPSLLQVLELYCLESMFQHIEGELEGILHGEEHSIVVKEEAEEKRKGYYQDFLVYKKDQVYRFVREYRAHRVKLDQRAVEVVDLILNNEVQLLYKALEKKAVKEYVKRKHYYDQLEHEENALLVDEVAAWVEENIVEFIFNYYAQALITAMWNVQDYRKGMLQYAGLLTVNMKKKQFEEMNISLINKKEDTIWMNNFLQATFEAEQKTIPLTKFDAAIRIQMMVRRRLAMKKMRRVFAKRFKKYFDEAFQRYYYYDNITGESSWTPPLLFKVLYPKADW